MPLDKEPEDQETQPEDLAEAQAELSSELFGQGNDEEEGKALVEGEEEKPSGDKTDVVALPPQPDEGEEEKVEGEVIEETSEEVQAVGAPKTWTKEALAEWATIPDRAKQEILKREEDFLRGITQYKEAADLGIAYSKVVEPYTSMLAAEGVDPVGLFQSFAANHYLLSRGTPEQKVEIAAALINGYNIPFAELVNYLVEGAQAAPIDPEVSNLKKELSDLKNSLSSAQRIESERSVARLRKEIDDFAADPAHPHFDELADDIHKLFESGMASSLAEAYEKAVYANPVTRQKEIDRLTTERASQAETEEEKRRKKVAKSTADQVKSGQKPRDGTVPKGSMEDTLAETMDAIEARG